MDDRQIKILEDLVDYLQYEKDTIEKQDSVYAQMMNQFIITLGEALEELND